MEVNKRKVDLKLAKILIKDISLGGMKIVTSLKLPVNSNMKFNIRIIDESRLVETINKMTVLRNLNKNIPDTNFVYEDSSLYFTQS